MAGKAFLLLAGLLIVTASFAGCSGKGGSKTAAGNGIPSVAPPGANDKDTCYIAGNIVDDEVNPVAGAQVGILGTDPLVKTTSAEDGTYSFSFLQPGAYSVAGTKPGYKSDLKPVQCEAGGEVKGMTLNMPRVPDPLQPYSRIFSPLHGRIACGVGYWAVSTEDKCRDAGIDTQSRTVFDYRADGPVITGTVFEIVWSPSGTFGGQYLNLKYQAIASKNPQVEKCPDTELKTGDLAQGKAPALCFTMRSVDGSDPIYRLREGRNVTLNIRPGSGDPLANPLDDKASKLIVGQTFDVMVALFYLGEPVPKGFTMRA